VNGSEWVSAARVGGPFSLRNEGGRCDRAGMLSDLSSFPMQEPLLPGGWSAPRYATGINVLDARLTGLGTGELWVFTSAAGQGTQHLAHPDCDPPRQPAPCPDLVSLES
jgi:hypothetical protein